MLVLVVGVRSGTVARPVWVVNGRGKAVGSVVAVVGDIALPVGDWVGIDFVGAWAVAVVNGVAGGGASDDAEVMRAVISVTDTATAAA